jgi:hypothetical protein
VIKSDDPIRYPRHFSLEVKANGGRSAGKGTVAGDRNLDWFPPQDREALFLCIDRFLFPPEGKRRGKRSEVARRDRQLGTIYLYHSLKFNVIELE